VIKGKIVLIPFPFDDLSASKVRPAVCLTNQIGDHAHVVLAFISSVVPSDLLTSDLVIDASSVGFVETGLRVTSVLRLHRLMTVSSSLVLRDLGELPPALQADVTGRLKMLFGI
jgi:mRNA interferase MazF